MAYCNDCSELIKENSILKKYNDKYEIENHQLKAQLHALFDAAKAIQSISDLGVCSDEWLKAVDERYPKLNKIIKQIETQKILGE